MSYVIVTDSTNYPDCICFMADRRRYRKSFWTFNIGLAFIYKHLNAAVDKAKSLRYNNPRVMSLHDAQKEAISQLPIDPESDPSWDSHKNTF